MLVDFHLPLKPDLDFLSLVEFSLICFGNKIAHSLIHIDGRAAQGYFFKRISPFNQVAERDVATETGGVDIKRFRLKFFTGVLYDQIEIGHAFFDGQFFPGVLSMAGPVKGEGRIVTVFRCQMFAKMLCTGRVFTASESMGDQDDMRKGAGRFLMVTENQPAADTIAVFINVKSFFHDVMPLLSVKICICYEISIAEITCLENMHGL